MNLWQNPLTHFFMTRSTRLTQDYYDVIFEGYASAMPSPHELRSRVT